MKYINLLCYIQFYLNQLKKKGTYYDSVQFKSLVAEIRELSSRVIRWSRVIKFDSTLVFFFTETLVIF